MNIEMNKAVIAECEKLTKLLKENFTITNINVSLVPSNAFNRESLKSVDVYSFEFIIAYPSVGDGKVSTERHTSFLSKIGLNNYKFTRPKEGMMEALAMTVKEYDFNLVADGDLYMKDNIVGKFCESIINRAARDAISIEVTSAIKALGFIDGVDISHCFGYKITRYYKQTKLFDCDFELLVKREPIDHDYRRFIGKYTNGKLSTLTDKAGVDVDLKTSIMGVN